MGGRLQADPDGIQASAAGIRQTAQSFATSVQAFHGQVQSLVQPPGNDPISPLIWSAHDAVLTAAARSFTSNTKALYNHADKLDQTAAAYRQADLHNADASSQIGE